jgi:hypothetical protein
MIGGRIPCRPSTFKRALLRLARVASGEGRQQEDIPTGGAGGVRQRRCSAVSLGQHFSEFLLTGRLPKSGSTDNFSYKSKASN